MPPFMFYLKDFMPLIATMPLAVVAVWIANRWLKIRRGDAELPAEIAALRQEVDALRRQQEEMREQLDFAERLLSQLRDGHLGLPRSL
jgi:hypothetical protein